MASSYSTSMRFELPSSGSQRGVWGTTFNTNIGTLIEQALGGYASVAITDANYTLSALYGATDEARNMVLNITGTITVARDVLCPTGIEKVYIVTNSTTGGFSIVFKPSGGTGVTIPNGDTKTIYVQGTAATDVMADYATIDTAQTLSNKNVQTVASTTSLASLRVPHGTAPTSPTNGDVWSTTTTLNLRLNGATKSIAFTDSNITGTAANVTGTVAIANGGTGATTASAARTALGLGSIATQASSAVTITGGSISGITDLAVADGGTGASDAATARTNLGLGSMATQASGAVSISGGSISGITDLAIADGGTGASTASAARTALGLIIGTDVQAYNVKLDTITGMTALANKVVRYTNSAGSTGEMISVTDFAVTLLDDTDAATARSTLGITAGIWTHIATLTPSAVASVEQTGLSAYKALRITGINLLPASDNNGLHVRISSDSATYLSASYDAHTYQVTAADAGQNNNANNSFFIRDPGGNQWGNVAADGGLDFEIVISSFSAAQKTKAYGSFVMGRANGDLVFGILQGWQTALTAMQAIQFIPESGNIASGTIVIEGIL